MSEKKREKNWKQRSRIGTALLILSAVVVLAGILGACSLYTMLEVNDENTVSRQEWIEFDALNAGYKCYRVLPSLHYVETQERGDIYTASTEDGELFGILFSENTKEKRTGMHAAYLNVFVMEKTTEPMMLDGEEITLYTDCYASLDYIEQGGALAGTVMAIFVLFGTALIFVILLTVGIVLKVSARKARGAFDKQYR